MAGKASTGVMVAIAASIVTVLIAVSIAFGLLNKDGSDGPPPGPSVIGPDTVDATPADPAARDKPGTARPL